MIEGAKERERSSAPGPIFRSSAVGAHQCPGELPNSLPLFPGKDHLITTRSVMTLTFDMIGYHQSDPARANRSQGYRIRSAFTLLPAPDPVRGRRSGIRSRIPPQVSVEMQSGCNRSRFDRFEVDTFGALHLSNKLGCYRKIHFHDRDDLSRGAIVDGAGLPRFRVQNRKDLDKGGRWRLIGGFCGQIAKHVLLVQHLKYDPQTSSVCPDQEFARSSRVRHRRPVKSCGAPIGMS
ncbi:Ig kappa chain V region [Anopheles sinensis]|uniref:Ig kappa chain V region n=1 Tax=Anopheles sinensis TaxID=74873 RepID=A0A084WU52_ANOSI|nr:Ig kappa chain V region [Anopheles sinensis]